MASVAKAAESEISRLDWESNHFGFSSAQLIGPDLDDDALATLLRDARTDGVRLLVWAVDGERHISRQLLSEFGGMLVDKKATFSRPFGESADTPTSPPGLAVLPYTSATVSPSLVELSIIAGGHSRFCVDPHFARDKFEALYRIWIERSVNKEMADEVLVVPAADGRNDALERPLGMITLSESNRLASIGLVAVAAAAQGQGIGSALMRAAHNWMQRRGAREARVVTQLANAAACRLYERSGYALSRVQSYCHFWL